MKNAWLKLSLIGYLMIFSSKLLSEWLQNKKPVAYAAFLLVAVFLAGMTTLTKLQESALLNQLSDPPQFANYSDYITLELDRADAVELYGVLKALASAYPPNLFTETIVAKLADWLGYETDAALAWSTIKSTDPIRLCSGTTKPDQTFVISCGENEQ